MSYQFAQGLLTIPVDTRQYCDDVIYKCIYWYTGKYNVAVVRASDHVMNIIFRLGDDNTAADELYAVVQRDLIDFKVRDIVSKETSVVRELLVAKAFANFNDEGGPLTDASDPVGFNPNTL